MKKEEPAYFTEKQIMIGLRTCAEEGDEDCARQLRESFENVNKAVTEGRERYIHSYKTSQDKKEIEEEKQSFAEALYWLGQHYRYAIGTKENDDEAIKWYKKAAALGSADGMHMTAWAYGRGEGVEYDGEKFYEWEKKAAIAYYNEGRNDDAFHAMECLDKDRRRKDEEIRELNRALRYESEAKGIVSNVSPEKRKHYADLAERLGIKVEDNDETRPEDPTMMPRDI